MLLFTPFVLFAAATNQADKANERSLYFQGKKLDVGTGKAVLTKAFAKPTSKETNAVDVASHRAEDVFLDLNGEKVLWGAVDEQIDLLLASSPLPLPPEATAEDVGKILQQTRVAYARKMVNLYVRNALIAQQARQEGLTLSEQELAQALTNSLRKYDEEMRAKIAPKIANPASFFHRDMVNFLLTVKYRTMRLAKDVTVAPEDVQKAMQERKEEIARLKQENAQMKPRMETWLAELRKGTRDFAETAFEFSDCTSSDDEGVLGEIERDSAIPPPLKAFAFSAQENVLSDVIETPESYHIAKVVKRKFDAEDGDVSQGPTSVVLAHIMLEKNEIPPELTEAAARESVFKRNLGVKTVELQSKLLSQAKVSSAFPVKLSKRKASE